MAGAKEIRTKIKSIKNTQKITRAMEMVSASKMRRAQESMRATRPYAAKMRNVICHLAHAHPEYRPAYLIERPAKRVGYIIVSTDRGLCGGLNVNLFKATVASMRKWREQNVEMDFCTIGGRAGTFFKRLGGNIVARVTQLGDTPRITDLVGSVKVMLDAYDAGRIDRLFIVYNEFINTMSQKPRIDQLLPIVPNGDTKLKHHWDYIYEPDAKAVLDGLLMRYVESLVYQGLVENIASEQAARMVAMKSATDNAGNLIDELALAYNKARQAAITREISEIVSGAAAV
jgi:F-type H+-transporting ATPase subunit gamma